jgi:hypothetical protein
MVAEAWHALKRMRMPVVGRGASRHHAGRQSEPKPMLSFTLPDLLAIAWFLGAWIAYSIVIEKTAKGRSGLNALMNHYRDEWMEQLLAREMRMVDAQVTAALQNGTAFFASTSLIAIGGTLTLLRSTDEILTMVSVLPFGATSSRVMWEMKMMGLAVIFVYAFFKFAWSYRLFNYFAIMVGAPGAGLRTSRVTAMRRCRTPFQPRPARVFLRARLSRMVSGAVAAGAEHDRYSDCDVAAAIRVGVAHRLRSGCRRAEISVRPFPSERQ